MSSITYKLIFIIQLPNILLENREYLIRQNLTVHVYFSWTEGLLHHN